MPITKEDDPGPWLIILGFVLGGLIGFVLSPAFRGDFNLKHLITRGKLIERNIKSYIAITKTLDEVEEAAERIEKKHGVKLDLGKRLVEDPNHIKFVEDMSYTITIYRKAFNYIIIGAIIGAVFLFICGFLRAEVNRKEREEKI